MSAYASAGTLQPFSSDGCSRFPDGTWQQQDVWKSCCVAHDLSYWRGGTADERDHADAQLQQCLAQQGYPAIGWVMLLGVKVGGLPYWPSDFRWGYGWPFLRGFKALSAQEQQQIDAMLLQQGTLIGNMQ
ncbi:hypothetical protein [Motilimonas pumila]|uniref:hypothetical protein n=1 Tax=Motilimonas pumila TaxID=2303987 RepID=UPI001E44552E|nr:hypothetical protein [Motilimonas pumila]